MKRIVLLSRSIFLTTLSCVLLLTGCVVTPVVQQEVHTTTTTFRGEGHEQRGSIYVISANKEKNGSLEFQSYKSKIESKLAINGYKIARSKNDAEFIAVVSYGIDNGKSETISVPIFGQTGGGSTYSSGTVYGSRGAAYYSGLTYSMPTFGVTGSSAVSRTNYTRAVAIDILDAKSLKEGNVNKKYELRASSSGSCSIIAEVIDAILEGMFTGFPNESGKSNTVKTPGVFNC